MFFLFGVQDINKGISALEGVRQPCPHCHNHGCMAAERHFKCFSLFFVPVLPFYWEKRFRCEICRFLVVLDKNQVNQLRQKT